ncbi:hypothetical protein GYMLUDRAFT_43098 [Collybiopsis luxurians FD-317 M1]|uniref:Uncharacterized protein n=1 Tax=Collybiopsis luxurians FD-317 M1 TaxID=944289 RepID=A0A0D0CEP4_9AGAR|nr:hypothetical protein GYMLUDRAFT_43098 [Collybiopsis luxurians FD-317 M1]
MSAPPTSASRVLTKEECTQFVLEPADMDRFNGSAKGSQNIMLSEWKVGRTLNDMSEAWTPFRRYLTDYEAVSQSFSYRFSSQTLSLDSEKKQPYHKFLWV